MKQDYCLACMLAQYIENIFNTIRKRQVLEKVNYILFVTSLQFILLCCRKPFCIKPQINGA